MDMNGLPFTSLSSPLPRLRASSYSPDLYALFRQTISKARGVELLSLNLVTLKHL